MTKPKRPIGESQALFEGPRPTHAKLLLVPIDMSASGMVAILSERRTEDFMLWMFLADGARISAYQIATAVALFAINDRHTVFKSGIMPMSPSEALMFKDGTLRHSHSRTFAPWVHAELSRLAVILLAKHSEYILRVQEVLRGRTVQGFTHPPADFVLSDPMQTTRLAPQPPALNVDLSGCPETRANLEWKDAVAIDYERDRYLSHLSLREIGKRTANVIGNMHTETGDDLSKLTAGDPLYRYWMERFAEVHTEMRLRFGAPYPAGWKGIIDPSEFPNSFNRSTWKFTGPLPRPQSLARPMLVKYGERRWMEKMLREGEILVSPASRYNDKSLNSAIHDDERYAEIEVGTLGLIGFGGLPGTVAAQLPTRHRITKKIDTNYYVYCTSLDLFTRIAHDFGYDAALVIRDPEVFHQRLSNAMRVALPSWRQITCEVEYYDPLQVSEGQVDVLTYKHFRYAYQREVRMAWLPPINAQDLDPLRVCIGALEDIGELVVPPRTD